MTPLAAPGAQQLDSGVPILFLPVRLETRFGQGNNGPELWVRVYPDQIAVDTHEDPLTPQEQADGSTYWAAVGAAGGVASDSELLKRPWRDLATAHGSPRAAWIVDHTDPYGPQSETRSVNYQKVPTAEALPDFWNVVGYVGGFVTVRATGAAIRRPLAVGLDPLAIAFPSDIPVDEGMRWLVDFDEAVNAGMGVRIPITAQQQARGFDRILVYGLRQPGTDGPGEELFAKLINHHHYTDGLSWAPQGAPTKNTQDTASGFSRQDPGFEASFKVERMDPLTSDPQSDGAVSAKLLGLPPYIFDHVRYSDAKDLLDGEHMAQALWPATLGYFMTEVMSSVFTPDQVANTRQYFINSVRGRGPIAALRVGRTLYGVLPTTSITLRSRGATDPVEIALLGFLKTAIPLWLKSSVGTPRVGGSSDPDKDLAGILGMDASSMVHRARWVLGDDFTWNFFNFFFGWLNFGVNSRWWLDHFIRSRVLLNSFGYSALAPRVLNTSLGPDAFIVDYPRVQAGPLSETAWLTDDATLSDGTKVNYIRWLRQATVDEIRQESYPGPKPTSLLYRLLRQAILTEYYNQAAAAQVAQGTLQLLETLEKELISLGLQQTITRWGVLGNLESTTQETWAKYLHDVGPGSPYGALVDLFASFDYLADRPTAELDRLLAETLDVCCHRLDAWVTSIATKLLVASRTGRRVGPKLFIGGYGWVEGLQVSAAQSQVTGAESQRVARLDRDHPTSAKASPRVPRTDNGGYILAPSMPQATTAAVLRSGYLTHRNASSGQLLAVDLSSKRVRTALWIMDAVRQGQPLAAVLGFQFEQSLARAALNQYQQPFRDIYQLADAELTPGRPGETVAASQVVNGLALHDDWKKGVLSPGANWAAGLPQPGAEQDRVVDILKTLDDLMDALSDLSVAEAVHQITHGNPARAGGILDAMSKGERPPDVQVLNTPRGGLDLTHRVVVLLGDAGQLKAGWSTGAHPRATAELRLGNWLSNWLPDPTLVKCYVSYKDAGGTVVKAPVLLSELEVTPLDFVAMAHTSEVAQAGEIEQRILYKTLPPGATDAAIGFVLAPGTDDGKLSFPDAAFAARAWRDLVRGARPLSPADLIDPDRGAGSANDGKVDLAEINARAGDVLAALNQGITDIETARGGSDSGVRSALINASYLGVTSAIPTSIDEAGTVLGGRADAVLKEMKQRKSEAESLPLPAARPSGAIAVVQAVLGKEAVVLPLFSPPDNANLQLAFANSATLIGGDTDAPTRWIQQLTHVRPPISRLDNALTVTQLLNGTARPAPVMAQLPYNAGEQWIGAKLAALPPPGRLSAACFTSGDYTHSTSYAGLLIDEWPERIPSTGVTAGLSFHYEEPQARAPQVLLLAVCPDQRPAWDDEAILAILNETLDLAKIRTVDLDSIQEVGQILPALYLPFNAEQESISADIMGIT